MGSTKNIKLGIVGVCGRGSTFKKICESIEGLEIHAVCDINKEELEKSKVNLGALESYTDYEEMLEQSNIDAVLVSTPMNLHVPQSIAALKRNLHVFSEVTAGVSIEECKALVEASKTSKGIYVLAENYNYMKQNQMIKEMVEQGLFGTPYYAEGEYIHNVKDMMEDTTPWRRKWQGGIDGITYGTHSLGPIMQWMPGDRVKRVCCEGTGVRHKDNKGEDYCQSSSTMLCKTEKDALIKIRVDLISDRPHAGTNYQLQGTEGCYESDRSHGGKDKLYTKKLCPKGGWLDLDSFHKIPELAEKYMPVNWLELGKQAMRSGHGGSDFFEMLDFVKVINGELKEYTGIHEAMDLTLPGLVSQDSIAQNGQWLEVPDSRDW